MTSPEQERQAEQPEREERPYVSIEDKWKGEPPAVKVKLYDLSEEEATRIRKLAVATYEATAEAVKWVVR